ncbi:MAG TPA: efflux transporter outer membrane subunit [Vicinamibacterales bacterium]|nr:efflux transporter outer membrane subunit [Vicinamibacterales bacterium]
MAACLQVAGCMVGPDYKRPPVVQPEGFKSQAAKGDAPLIAPEWWRLYREPELDQLIATATASNQTLQQAVAAVDQARALARVARSFLAPTISTNPTFTRDRSSPNRKSAFTGQPVGVAATINDWLVPVDLTYELDVWGRVRRGLQSARAQAAATADDEAMVRLMVQTDVAQFYYTLRLLDAQTEILTQTVASYREQVRILSVQVKTGLTSPIVLSQAEALLQSTIAQQRDVERARADEEHALAILCGQPAPSFWVAANPLREVTPPEVPAGLPTMLLARRPDVAAAEQAVVASNAQIGVAMAAFYPTFSLSSFAGFESANLNNLVNWQSRVASIIPGVTLPIFTGGRLKANLQATRAQYRQTVAAYVNQVLTAYGDVEDALTDLHAYTDETGSLRSAVTASQEYLRMAQVQYRLGLVDYLTVTDAERTLLANQLALSQNVNLQVGASIHLIKALGGGWAITNP